MTSLSWPKDISWPHRELCSSPARKNKALVSEGRKIVWLSGTTNSLLAECSRSQRLVGGLWDHPEVSCWPSVPALGSDSGWFQQMMEQSPLAGFRPVDLKPGEVNIFNTRVETSFRSVWRL